MIGSESCTQQDSCEGSFGLVGVPPSSGPRGSHWLQFRERFRSHNVPAGVMKMKQKEFLALKQVILNIIISRFSFELIPPLSYPYES